MTWTIGPHSVARIAVVDDEQESRESLGWMLSDAELEMSEVSGPLADVESARVLAFEGADALICDHHLSVRNYARFAGAELVASSTRAGSLAILCTRFNGPDIDTIRPLLAYIPVIRRPDELDEPDELRRALTLCAAELAGDVPAERKTWRAQLVVERIEDETFDVSVPSWEIEESVRLRFEDAPIDVRERIAIGFRAYAQVNLGAESSDRLFVLSWET